VTSCGHQLDRRHRRIEVPLQRVLKFWSWARRRDRPRLSASSITLLRSTLRRSPASAARMLQHAANDAVCSPPVLGDLLEIAGQHHHRFIDLGALVLAECGDRWSRGLL